MSTPSGGEGQQRPGGDPGGDPYRASQNPPFPYGQGQPPPAGQGGQGGPGQGGQGGPGQGGGYGSGYGQPSSGSSYGAPPPVSPGGSGGYGQQPTTQFPAGPTPGYGQPGHQTPPPGQAGGQYGQPGYQAPPQSGYPAPGGYGQPPGQYGATPYGQPAAPYGQGDWSGSGTPAKKKSSAPLIAGILGLVVVIVIALLLILPQSPFGLGATYFDETAVADTIATQYEDEFDLGIEVDCPAEVEVVEGDDFQCNGMTEDGDEITLDVIITDAEAGAYEWSESS